MISAGVPGLRCQLVASRRVKLDYGTTTTRALPGLRSPGPAGARARSPLTTAQAALLLGAVRDRVARVVGRARSGMRRLSASSRACACRRRELGEKGEGGTDLSFVPEREREQGPIYPGEVALLERRAEALMFGKSSGASACDRMT